MKDVKGFTVQGNSENIQMQENWCLDLKILIKSHMSIKEFIHHVSINDPLMLDDSVQENSKDQFLIDPRDHLT